MTCFLSQRELVVFVVEAIESEEREWPPRPAGADEERWRLARAIAIEVFGPQASRETLWYATRAIYRMRVSTR